MNPCRIRLGGDHAAVVALTLQNMSSLILSHALHREAFRAPFYTHDKLTIVLRNTNLLSYPRSITRHCQTAPNAVVGVRNEERPR
ncbi:hypothetical protein M3J09_011377 [Ascochyta lentis]